MELPKTINRLRENKSNIEMELIQKGIVKGQNEMTPFYQSALNFLRLSIKKAAPKIPGVVMGAAHFYRKIDDQFQEGAKIYSVDERAKEWMETVITRTITKDEIPPKYTSAEDIYVLNGMFYVNDTKELLNAITIPEKKQRTEDV